jgi:hypothetical protein
MTIYIFGYGFGGYSTGGFGVELEQVLDHASVPEVQLLGILLRR